MSQFVHAARGALAAAVLAGIAFSTPALAEEQAEFSFRGQVAFTTDYVWRGLSQTDGRPAVQGELTLEHRSGLYVGIWGSNVDFDVDGADTNAHLELDYYVGFANQFAGIDYDFGYIAYRYPGESDMSSWELYGELSKDFGVLAIKGGGHWTNDYAGEGLKQYHLFGGTSVPVGPVTLHALAGYTDTEDDQDWTYWQLGVSTSLLGVDFDLSYHDTDEDEVDSRVVLTASKSF